jgi:hypothetical protein
MEELGGLGFEAGIFNEGYHLVLGQLACHRQNLVGIGRIHLPGLDGFFAVERGGNGFDAAAAVDVGLEFQGLHGAWV